MSLCGCGCGGEVSPGARFKRGHQGHTRVPDPLQHYEVDEKGCHVWKGGRTKGGYGIVYLPGGKRVYAHRLAWESHVGPIPPGKVLDHEECDNPPCMNVEHMVVTTQAENARRGQVKRWKRDRKTAVARTLGT